MRLSEVIEKRSKGGPSSIAVYAGSTQLSWRNLDTEVSRLCRSISAKAREGSVIGVSADAPLRILVTYLSALRVGGLILDLSHGGLPWDFASDGSTLYRVTSRGSRRGRHRHGNASGVVVPTSGTTGPPKLILHTESSLAWGAWNVAMAAEEQSATPPIASDEQLGQALSSGSPLGLTFLSAMSLRSISGLSIANRALAGGESLVLLSRPTGGTLAQALARLPVTSVGVSPFLAGEMLRAIRSGSAPPPLSLIACGIGGSHVPPLLCSELESALGVPVVTGYGSTELGGVALYSRLWDSEAVRWTTVGRPVGSVQFRLVDSPEGARLHVRSPSSMAGSFVSQEYRPHLSHWIDTGDRAEVTADGAVNILGRCDFVIQRGSRRIDPAPIEVVLEKHPAVERAGVLGVPSRVPGETDILALFTGSSPHVTDLRRFCAERLPVWAVPRHFVPVGYVPLANDGSVLRHDLERLAAEMLA